MVHCRLTMLTIALVNNYHAENRPELFNSNLIVIFKMEESVAFHECHMPLDFREAKCIVQRSEKG